MIGSFILANLVAAGFQTASVSQQTEGKVVEETVSACFDSKGVPIHYYSAGSGTPVILIHGWLSDATFWGKDKSGNPKLNPVSGYRVIALDCRGMARAGSCTNQRHTEPKWRKMLFA
jgi:hypothetical protein